MLTFLVLNKIFKDINDNSPTCPRKTAFYISENKPPRTVVGLFSAMDNDYGTNGTLNYRFTDNSDLFSIHPHHGIVIFFFSTAKKC